MQKSDNASVLGVDGAGYYVNRPILNTANCMAFWRHYAVRNLEIG